jgi:uncharacterized membrane protein
MIEPNFQEMSAWSSFAAAVIAGLVLIAAAIGLRQIWEARAARRGQVMAEIARRRDSAEFIEARAVVRL